MASLVFSSDVDRPVSLAVARFGASGVVGAVTSIVMVVLAETPMLPAVSGSVLAVRLRLPLVRGSVVIV